uniref:Ig-like domain-containing protein n=1 Tax=Amphimedon queenslandica TaxID=400682 RepID=A0A1X7UH69_AMPQE
MLKCDSGDVLFWFDSNHIVEVGQSAVYHCSVNDTHFSITWNINGSNVLPSDVDVVGAGTLSSNLTIPGIPQFNNTQVRCIAIGLVDGILATVIDLSCEQADRLCIKCSWSPPFSLTPVSQYIINISYADKEYTTVLAVLPTSNISYCPSQYGQFSISVSASNTVGPGNVTYATIDITQTEYTLNFNAQYLKESDNSWNVTITIENGADFIPSSINITVYLIDANSDSDSIIILRPGINEVPIYEEADLVLSVNLGTLPDKIWKLWFSLESHSFFINSLTTRFSTFDIINGNYSVTNITSGTVCFTCQFIEGVGTNTCYIEYSSLYTGLIGNITINRTDSIATSCIKGFYTDIYSIRFYDDKHDESPAIELDHQLITGLYIDNTLTTSCVTEGKSTLAESDTMYLTPSPTLIQCTRPVDTESSAYIISVTVSIILIVSVLIHIGLVIVCVRNTKSTSAHEISSVTSPVPQYENVELMPATSSLPPPLSVDELQLESCAAYGVVSQRH